jgi:serine/threonine protein kinase
MSKERKALEREVGIMKLLNHPNLMKLYDVYELQGHL